MNAMPDHTANVRKKVAPPGSRVARHEGCTCPVADNNNGDGIPGGWPFPFLKGRSWLVDEGCLIHGTKGGERE